MSVFQIVARNAFPPQAVTKNDEMEQLNAKIFNIHTFLNSQTSHKSRHTQHTQYMQIDAFSA